MLGALRERLPPGAREANGASDAYYSLVVGGASGRVKRFHLLYLEGARIARTLELDEALAAFETDTRFRVAMLAEGRVFVHAGVVGWRGGAILVPGASFAGKTTLVAELVRAGATYFSDEFAVIDERGRVHPFSKALSIRHAGGAQRVDPRGLGAVATRPLPVRAIADVAWKQSGRWRVTAASPGQGVLALLRNAVTARMKPDAVLPTLTLAAANAVVVRGSRGEAAEAAAALLALAERSAA